MERKNPEGLGKKQSQITEQIDMLGISTTRLHEKLDSLYERIIPIMSESPPEKIGNEVENQLVPLADTIRSMRYSVDNATTRVEDMLSRIEL